MGYPKDFLETRAIIKHGVYAVVPPEGRVINVLPGFEGFDFTILASPKMGANCVFYIADVHPGAETIEAYGEDDVEVFLYVLSGTGRLQVTVETEKVLLAQGGYIFVPAGKKLQMRGEPDGAVKILMYKQRYRAIQGHAADVVTGNTNEISERIYADMENVFIKDLLPTHLGFDMNMHILSFDPAGCHPFMETHVQEHGAYITEGQGFYRLGDDWVQVKKDDFLWMAPFSVQGTYATGRQRFTYIYSKDCNRDEPLL